MVLKQYKGFNTGNTVRAIPSKRSKGRGDSNFHIQSTNNDSWNSGEIVSEPDQERFASGVSYSTKKRGRWQLKERWINEISSNSTVSDDSHLVVLQENASVTYQRGTCRQFVSNNPRNSGQKTLPNKTFMNERSLMGEARLVPDSKETKESRIDEEENAVPCRTQSRSQKKRENRRNARRQVDTVTSIIFHTPLPETSALRLSSSFVGHRKYHKGLQTKRSYAFLNQEDHYDDIDEIADSVEKEILAEAMLESCNEMYSGNIREQCASEFAIYPEEKPQKTKKKSHKKNKRESESSSNEDDLVELSWVDIKESDESHMTNSQIGETLEPNFDLTDPILMLTKRILLPKSDIEPESLLKHLSKSYLESESYPRQFLIDLTPKLTESWGYNTTQLSLVAALIITENSEKSSKFDKLAICTVRLNMCFLESTTTELFDLIGGNEYTLDDVVNCAVNQVLQFPIIKFNLASCERKQCFLHEEDRVSTLSGICTPRFQNDRINSYSEQMPASCSPAVPAELTNCADSSWVTICGICLEPLTDDLESRGSTCGLSLNRCGHTFCSECWRQHLIAEIRSGHLTLRCAEPACKTIVDTTTCLSLVSLPLYSQHKSLINTVALEKDPKLHWCPNVRCNRLIRCFTIPNTESSTAIVHRFTIKCHCGTVFCSQCHTDAHWPASCETAKRYRDKLRQYPSFTHLWGKGENLKIMGRNCQKCGNFIEKNGGCNHMTCRCGYQFCWFCLGPFTSVNHPGGPCTVYNTPMKFTPRVALKFESEDSSALCALEKTKSGKVFVQALKLKRIQLKLAFTARNNKSVAAFANLLAKESGLDKKILNFKTCSTLLEEYSSVRRTALVNLTKLDELRRIIEYIYAAAWDIQPNSLPVSSRLHNQARRLHQLHDRIEMLVSQTNLRSFGYGNGPSRMEAILNAFSYAQSLIQGCSRCLSTYYSSQCSVVTN